MKKINELKAGALLSYVNLGLGCIIPLFYTPVMLDILGQSEYGLYSLSSSVTSYLSLLNFGVGAVVVRYITKYKVTDDYVGVRKVLGLFLTIYSVIALLVCAGGVILSSVSDVFFSEGLTPAEVQKLKILIVIMSLSMAITFIQSVFSAVCVAFEKYIFQRVIAIMGTVAVPAFNLLILFAGFGSAGMACVGAILQLLFTLLYIIHTTKRLGITPIFKNMPTNLLKELFGFCAFVFLASVVDLLYWSTDKVLIGATLGSAAVAVYNVGGVFTSMMQSMSSSISNVFTPRVTTLVVKKAPVSEISELLIRIGRIQFLIVSLILSGYITFGKKFIFFWAGAGYSDAYYIALLTMIPLAIPLIQSIAFSTVMAQNKHHFRAIAYAVIAVVNLVATVIVLPHFGIIGAAACTGIAFILGNGIIMNIYYYRVIGLDIPGFWKNILKMAIVPIAAAAVFSFLISRFSLIENIIQFLTAVVLYIIVFGLLSWFITMNRYEKELLLGLLKPILRIKNKP